MVVSLRAYDAHDFTTLYRMDQSCFPPGIAYSKTILRYFLAEPSAACLIAIDNTDGGTEKKHKGGAKDKTRGATKKDDSKSATKIVGFILTEANPPLAHVITLDVAEKYRRSGVGSMLLAESEKNLAFLGVRHILLETATNNDAGVAFWQRHGYRIEATLQRYYLGRLDAYEMRKVLSNNKEIS